MNLKNIIFKWLFPLTFKLLGALLMIFGVKKLFTADASKSWPTTTGVKLVKRTAMAISKSKKHKN